MKPKHVATKIAKTTKRMRRSQLLPWVTLVETTHQFNPTSDNWEKIGAPYGLTFEDENKSEIIDIINRYFAHEHVESQRVRMADARAWLDNITIPLSKVCVLLKTKTEMTHDDAAAYAKQMITGKLNDLLAKQLGIEVKWANINRFCNNLLVACKKARSSMEPQDDDGVTPDGFQWKQMVSSLMEFANSRDLSYSVSKRQNKKNASKQSPFVEFMWQLQCCFPKEFRRHGQSKSALAMMLSRIRSEKDAGR